MNVNVFQSKLTEAHCFFSAKIFSSAVSRLAEAFSLNFESAVIYGAVQVSKLYRKIV